MEEISHRAEYLEAQKIEQELEKKANEEKAAFQIFAKLKNDAFSFLEEVKSKNADLFDQNDNNVDLVEKRIKNKEDLAKLRIYKCFMKMRRALEKYVNIVDQHQYIEKMARSGPEHPYYDAKEKIRANKIASQKDNARLDAHNNLLNSLNDLMITYQNAGLDYSWRNDIKFDRYNVQVWAENVRDMLNAAA